MEETNLNRLQAALEKLTVFQAVVVSEAEGISISRKDRRSRSSLLTKWKGQDASTREKLILRTYKYLSASRM